MTLRERILAVYRGDAPDVVPFMLDLSHWYYHKHRLPWDISRSYDQPEYELIDYHRRKGVGFYVPNLGNFYSSRLRDDVHVEVTKSGSPGHEEITWRYSTPLGTIARTRAWEEGSYSWAIRDWGVKTEQDLRVLGYALSGIAYTPSHERYQAWVDAVGDDGVVCILPGYSAMGYLLNYWMGIEETMFAICDNPQLVHAVVGQINENNLRMIDMLVQYPGEIVLMGDNFSGEIQPPAFFAEWSKPYYVEAIRRIHAAGKYVAVHIDGKMHGALEMIRDAGADACDAATPAPMGDLTPAEARAEAGPRFILSGGVSPNVWLPEVDTATFKQAVLDWLELRKISPRLIAAAGDQVPPGAVEERIEIMRDLVEQYGRY